MTVNEPLSFMPLDLDTFSGSERFMAGTRLGAAFSQGIRAYLRASYSDAIEHFKAALIAAYVEGEEQAQIFDRERAIIYLYIGNALAFQEDWDGALREYLEALQKALIRAGYTDHSVDLGSVVDTSMFPQSTQ